MEVRIKQAYMSNIDKEIKRRVKFLIVKDAEK